MDTFCTFTFDIVSLPRFWKYNNIQGTLSKKSFIGHTLQKKVSDFENICCMWENGFDQNLSAGYDFFQTLILIYYKFGQKKVLYQ